MEAVIVFHLSPQAIMLQLACCPVVKVNPQYCTVTYMVYKIGVRS
jgi:hypothetical protein